MRSFVIKELQTHLSIPGADPEPIPLTTIPHQPQNRDTGIQLPAQPSANSQQRRTSASASPSLGIDGPARRRPIVIELSDSSSEGEVDPTPVVSASVPAKPPSSDRCLPLPKARLTDHLRHLQIAAAKKIVVLTGPSGCSKLSAIQALVGPSAASSTPPSCILAKDGTQVTISPHYSLELGEESSAPASLRGLQAAIEDSLLSEQSGMSSYFSFANHSIKCPGVASNHAAKKNEVILRVIKDLPVRGAANGGTSYAQQQAYILESCYRYVASLIEESVGNWARLIEALYSDTVGSIPCQVASSLFEALRAHPAHDTVIIFLNTIHDTHSEKVGLRSWLPKVFIDASNSNHSPLCMISIPPVTEINLAKQMRRVLSLVQNGQQNMHSPQWKAYEVGKYLTPKGKGKAAHPLVDTIAASASGDIRQALLQLQWGCLKIGGLTPPVPARKSAPYQSINVSSILDVDEVGIGQVPSAFEVAATRCTWQHSSPRYIDSPGPSPTTECIADREDTLAAFRNETLELAHATARLLTRRYTLDDVINVLPSSGSSGTSGDCPPHKIYDYFLHNMPKYYCNTDAADGSMSQLDSYASISATASLVDQWIPSPQQGLLRLRDTLANTTNAIIHLGGEASTRLHDTLGMIGLTTVVSAYRALHQTVYNPQTFMAMRPPPYIPQGFPITNPSIEAGVLEPLVVANSLATRMATLVDVTAQLGEAAALTSHWPTMRTLLSDESQGIVGMSPEAAADAGALLACICFGSSSPNDSKASPSTPYHPSTATKAQPAAPKRTLLLFSQKDKAAEPSVTPPNLSQVVQLPTKSVEGIAEVLEKFLRMRYTKQGSVFAIARRHGCPLSLMTSGQGIGIYEGMAKLAGISLARGKQGHAVNTSQGRNLGVLNSRFSSISASSGRFSKLEPYYSSPSYAFEHRSLGGKSARSDSPLVAPFFGDVFSVVSNTLQGSASPSSSVGWCKRQGVAMFLCLPVGLGLFEEISGGSHKACNETEEIEDWADY